jgi:hypothetical protein
MKVVFVSLCTAILAGAVLTTPVLASTSCFDCPQGLRNTGVQDGVLDCSYVPPYGLKYGQLLIRCHYAQSSLPGIGIHGGIYTCRYNNVRVLLLR